MGDFLSWSRFHVEVSRIETSSHSFKQGIEPNPNFCKVV